MNKNEHLDLEMLVLQRLVGKMTLMLTDLERESLVNTALEEVLNDEGKDFADGLVSVEDEE